MHGGYLDSNDEPVNDHRHIERWPGIGRPIGWVHTRSALVGRLAVSFNYYKTDPATGVLEAQHRLVLVDPDHPFAYGVLTPADESSPPTGHEGEADTWYLRGIKLGTVAAGANVDLDATVREALSKEQSLATNSFSMARIIGGVIGDPFDPVFRQKMGIREVPLPPDFVP